LGILDEESDSSLDVLECQCHKARVSLFNPIFSLLKADQVILNQKFLQAKEHNQWLDIDEDILYRKTTYRINDVDVTIKSERFVDQIKRKIFINYSFQTNKEIQLDFYHGFNLNINHVKLQTDSIMSKLHHLCLKTNNGMEMTILYEKDFRHKNKNRGNQALEHYQITTEPNRVYSIKKYIAIDEIDKQHTKDIKTQYHKGYEELRDEYRKAQILILKDASVNVINNDMVQTMIDFSTRQMMNRQTLLDVNAFGLKTYFESYYLLHNQPAKLKEKIIYLLSNIDRAKNNAESIGHQGILLVDDKVLFDSGTYHILSNALFVRIIFEYINYTNDVSFLEEVFDMVLESNLFYLDYAEHEENQNHYNIKDVSNIDYSLNHINNHTLTNYFVKSSLKQLKEMARLIKKVFKNKQDSILMVFKEKEKKLNHFYHHLYIMKPNIEDLIFPYQNFQDDYENQRLYLENNQVIFSFDQLLLLNFEEHQFSKTIKTANLNYCEKHIKLSLFNKLFLSLIELEDTTKDNHDYMMDSLSVKKQSLLLQKKYYGAIYYQIVHRMSCLRRRNTQFSVDTWIPKSIRRLEYSIKFRKYIGEIKIKRNSAQINWVKEDES